MPIRISKNRLHVDVPATFQGTVNYAAASGTDTYIADPSPSFTTLTTGAHFFISFTNANTSTTPTININGLGAKTIVKEGSSALSAGDIPAGHKGILMYDGANMALLNPKASSRTPTMQVFISSGTWTKPAGCRKIRVRVIGGGGGGGANGGTDGGGGGGGGGYAEEWIDVSGVSTVAVTVGAGGAGGTGTGAGATGDSSSFGAYCSATGGAGGAGGSAGTGGAGGVGTGGDLNIGGQAGDGGSAVGAHGGSSALGGGGARQAGPTGGYGGGAGGSGGGAAGVVIVEEY